MTKKEPLYPHIPKGVSHPRDFMKLTLYRALVATQEDEKMAGTMYRTKAANAKYLGYEDMARQLELIATAEDGHYAVLGRMIKELKKDLEL